MYMMGIGFPELMVILVIIMIIFGAGKLPEIGSAFGQSIRNFKKSMKEAEELDETPSTPAQSAAVPDSGHAHPALESPPKAETVSAEPSSGQAVTANAGEAKVTAQSGTAPKQPDPSKPAGPKKEKKKDAAEKLIEDAINELKEKRIGTIKTPHDGLVQQGDVFTESLKRTPFGRGRDRGVSRDIF